MRTSSRGSSQKHSSRQVSEYAHKLATARSSGTGALEKPYAAIIPDILLEQEGPPFRRVPVDAKYKLYDDRKIDQSDIYQTFFYAWAYADPLLVDDAPAFILYPGDGHGLGEHLVARTSYGEPGASIRVIPIDVPEMLTAIRANDTEKLTVLRDVLS